MTISDYVINQENGEVVEDLIDVRQQEFMYDNYYD